MDAKINNLESNLHIEIDMERIEDKSKALSYIGIEIAEALKYIPAPAVEFTSEEKISSQIVSESPDEIVENENNSENTSNIEEEISNTDTEELLTDVSEDNIITNFSQDNTDSGNILDFDNDEQNNKYIEETRFEVKPTLWQRIKNSKFVRTISYILKIRVVLDYPALPEGNIENR